MKKMFGTALLLLAAASTLVAAAGSDEFELVRTKSTARWMPLYNKRDLSGWHVEGEGAKLSAWKANGELISCVAPGGGFLATDREYGDFELKLEYRIPPAGNTGVGIRFPRGGWPSVDGMEIQILDDDAPQYKDLKPEHRCGSIYTFVGPKVKAFKPAGQWNRMVIRCRGEEVVVRLNGREVTRARMSEHPETGKGTVALKDRPRRGLIGLQSHGDPVDFRNIQVREL
jgi:hypothetical protein